MNDQIQPHDTLRDIKQMMERSSRFISLSGLSGVAAGICALVGAWLGYTVLQHSSGNIDYKIPMHSDMVGNDITLKQYMGSALFQIAVGVLITALVFGFLFTYLRSRKTGIPVWGTQARRLLINMAVPMIAGGIYLLKLIDNGNYGLIAPGCLLFYGLSLLNASRYTLPEIRYLGYAEISLGLINLWFIGNGLWFWAVGFGLLHILYGAAMWWKYERGDDLK